MTTVTFAGVDMGNNWTNVCVSWPGCKEGLVAKIPSRYSYNCPPGQINTSGQLGKPQAFPLVFSQDNGNDLPLWFGQDTLAIPAIQKLDDMKYDAAHISVLFRAALYQWEQTHKGRHKVDLAALGKMIVVVSMPPGLFKDQKIFSKATDAYEKAFNGKSKQSHQKIRGPKRTVQIVTQFGGLQQEAVAWGADIPRRDEWILVVDLGGGTDDYALYNGSPKPRETKTSNTGLLHVYAQINPVDPGAAELEILRNKKGELPKPLLTYYNEVERRIQLFTRRLPVEVSRIYVIGGGAALMPAHIQRIIKQLAPRVVIKDEYANCRANWNTARGK
jgi:hypothetical protein